MQVGLSPGVSECLLTGEALGRIFFHETADEILGWRTRKETKTFTSRLEEHDGDTCSFFGQENYQNVLDASVLY